MSHAVGTDIENNLIACLYSGPLFKRLITIPALLCFFMYYGFDLLVLFFSNAIIQDFISMFGISYHYDSMSRGVIDTRDVVYFITVSLVFVYSTCFCIAKRR